MNGKRNSLIVNMAVVVACIGSVEAQQDSAHLIIGDFTSPGNQSDYLIITTDKFESCAFRLAAYRNGSTGGDVKTARVALIEDIDSLFPFQDSAGSQKSLWTGLKWAYDHWSAPLHYVVFIGDDSIGWDPTKTAPVNFGPVPSFLNGYYLYGSPSPDTIFDYSDDYFSVLNTTSPLNLPVPSYDCNIILGRIPCETVDQCNLYIDKVIQFESPLCAGWKNGAVLMADDALQGSNPDPLGHDHFISAEKIADTLSQDGFCVSKVYCSAIPRDPTGWALPARDTLLEKEQDGNLWSVYFGHGYAGGLTSERFLSADDAQLFENDNKTTVFLSFSCENGAFHTRYANSMCKQMLFDSDAGAIAYVASTTLEYASSNEDFGRTIFAVYDSLPGATLGNLITTAKKKCYYDLIYHYHLLGDPALRIGGQKTAMHYLLNNSNLSVQMQDHAFTSGSARVTLYRPKMCKLLDDTSYSYENDSLIADWVGGVGNTWDVAIPKNVSGTVKVVSYAWKDNMEGRSDTIITVPQGMIALNPIAASESLPMSISVRHSIASITFPKVNGTVTVSICDISGRLIAQLSTPRDDHVLQVNLKEFGIGAGQFVAAASQGTRSIGVARFVVCN